MKLEIIEIEGVDAIGDPQFSVKAFDASSATVELRTTVHNAKTWKELAAWIGLAIERLELCDEDQG